MQQEELLNRIERFSNYIVKRFNEDFKNNPDGLILQIRKLKYRKGFNLFFNKREMYFDVDLLTERVSKGNNFQLLLGTIDIYYLGDETTESEYYFIFLRVINKLFKKQSLKKDLYFFEFPRMINILTSELSKYDRSGYIQETLPV